MKNMMPDRENEIVEFKSSLNDEVIVSLVAFSNAKGGTVYVGVSNNGNKIGVSIGSETIPKFINEIKSKTTPFIVPDVEIIDLENGKKLVILSVSEYPIKPVSFQGKYYKRVQASNHQLSSEEVANIHLHTINSSWDMFPDPIHSIETLSNLKIRKSRTLIKSRGITVDKSIDIFLDKFGLVRDGRPTFGAYLMFMKNKDDLTSIDMGRFQDEITIKDDVVTKSDIISQVDEVIEFVKKHTNCELVISGAAPNIRKWQYPLDAIREIVLNMIIHRDYRSAASSSVIIYNDRIEFYNPGKLPEDITVEKLLSNNYKSTPRNKKIAGFFKEMGWIERYGSGIKRIIGYFKEQNMKIPEFRNISVGFQVTVFADAIKSVDGTKLPDNLTDNQRLILENIAIKPSITSAELSGIIGIGATKIRINLAKLKDKGIIERVGSDKKGFWVVKYELK